MLLQIDLSREMNFADAFTIQAVDKKMLQNFNFVAGTSPSLSKLLKDIR